MNRREFVQAIPAVTAAVLAPAALIPVKEVPETFAVFISCDLAYGAEYTVGGTINFYPAWTNTGDAL